MAEPLIVRVLPDVGAIGREFDYSVPGDLVPRVTVGTMVRVPLHGRRVAGWVTALDVTPPAGVVPVPLSKVSGIGPSEAMIDLCRWASWRWAGRLTAFLRMASPPTMVASPRVAPRRHGGPAVGPGADDPVIADAFSGPRAMLRLPPAEDVFPVALAAAARGDALIVCPSIDGAHDLALRLRRAGVPVALHPRDWATAAGGATVVGARAAAFAPMPDLAAVVVVDAHDEALQSESSPTWHAREVALERARRARVPAVLVSPCPTLEGLSRTRLVTVDRARERAGWATIDVIDRRDEDRGRSGLYSSRLVAALRPDPRRPGGPGRAVCVLNRLGRARLLACATCGTTAACDACSALVVLADGPPASLVCPRCGAGRPVVCTSCSGTTMKNLRVGVSRAREELEALLGEPVAELTGAAARPGGGAAGDPAAPTPPLPDPDRTRVVVGTEAVLHRVHEAAVVAFLDLDQELLAVRYRAAEEAMALLARAARIVGPRGGGGRVVVQTRLPDHEVVVAATRADPSLVSAAEQERRALVGRPPAVMCALVGGEAAPAFIEALGHPAGIEQLARDGGEWLLRATDRRVLLDALAATERPPGRLRLQIDPPRW